MKPHLILLLFFVTPSKTVGAPASSQSGIISFSNGSFCSNIKTNKKLQKCLDELYNVDGSCSKNYSCFDPLAIRSEANKLTAKLHKLEKFPLDDWIRLGNDIEQEKSSIADLSYLVELNRTGNVTNVIQKLENLLSDFNSFDNKINSYKKILQNWHSRLDGVNLIQKQLNNKVDKFEKLLKEYLDSPPISIDEIEKMTEFFLEYEKRAKEAQESAKKAQELSRKLAELLETISGANQTFAVPDLAAIRGNITGLGHKMKEAIRKITKLEESCKNYHYCAEIKRLNEQKNEFAKRLEKIETDLENLFIKQKNAKDKAAEQQEYSKEMEKRIDDHLVQIKEHSDKVQELYNIAKANNENIEMVIDAAINLKHENRVKDIVERIRKIYEKLQNSSVDWIFADFDDIYKLEETLEESKERLNNHIDELKDLEVLTDYLEALHDYETSRLSVMGNITATDIDLSHVEKVLRDAEMIPLTDKDLNKISNELEKYKKALDKVLEIIKEQTQLNANEKLELEKLNKNLSFMKKEIKLIEEMNDSLPSKCPEIERDIPT